MPGNEALLDLTSGPGDPATAARLAEVFRAACEAEGVRARLTGPPAGMELCFEPQESAPADLILRTFVEEAAGEGLRVGPVLRPPALEGAAWERAAAALRRTVARIRALLVEHNSYMSAGLPYVFPEAEPAIRERGLAVYRYPARAPAQVEIRGEVVRIEVPPGDLGAVTSTGFYVPTVLAGDFLAEVRFRVGPWKPGRADACLGLFAQDERSLYRLYAQFQSRRGAVPCCAGTLQGEQRGTIPLRAGRGTLSLRRTGRRLQARANGKLLGDWLVEAIPERVVVGCKVWSHGRVGGLRAELANFRLAGTPAAEQPLLVVKPDPRREVG